MESLQEMYEWLCEHRERGSVLFLTRLSHPETQSPGNASGLLLHERGVAWHLFPELVRRSESDPVLPLRLLVDSHREIIPAHVACRASPDETGDAPYVICPVTPGPCRFLEPELCGGLMVLAAPFLRVTGDRDCHLWIARSDIEEDAMESSFGGLHYRWALRGPGIFRCDLV